MDAICKPDKQSVTDHSKPLASLAALSLVEKLKHWLSWEKPSNKWYSKLRRYKTQKSAPGWARTTNQASQLRHRGYRTTTHATLQVLAYLEAAAILHQQHQSFTNFYEIGPLLSTNQ